ncbi:MAG: aspartate/glutamate racemase family protein [Myxococcota bacterium]|nr:aspartate/glutamate racemase family protein [Myxococcota bacterium]
MRLGTLDWGIGGLSVHRALLEAGVAESAVYLSDAGFTPYGKLDDDALAARVADRVEFLRSLGCTHVVLGCNAASTVIDHPRVQAEAAELSDLLGVIAPAVEAVRAARPADVAILGGRRTVESDAYGAPLREAGVQVRQRVAQPLSALIEAGVLSGPALDAELEEICAPVADARAVVLACTHYPAIASAITARFAQLELTVDPAVETARVAVERWGARHPARVVDDARTSGDPIASERAAHAAFGAEVRFVPS